MVAGAQPPAFDGALASTLFPAAVRLADLATHSTPAQAPGGTGAAQNEAEGTGKRPTATQEQLSAQVSPCLPPLLGHSPPAPSSAHPVPPTQAAALKRNLATLSAQAESLPAGQLGLEDQDWLIGQLEARVEQTRCVLARVPCSGRVRTDSGLTLGSFGQASAGSDGGTERHGSRRRRRSRRHPARVDRPRK